MQEKPRIASVEPSMTEEERRHRTFYDIPIRGSAQLRKKLKMDDIGFRRIWGPNTGAPRDYYLYGVLNEVEKAGASMMQHADFIRESRAAHDPKKLGHVDQRLADNILQAHIDELAIWERKMTEMLIDLVGFRRANKEGCYRHYITLHELIDKRRIQTDFVKFHNCYSQNLADQITELEQKCDQLAVKLEPMKCWYAKVEKGKIKRQLGSFEGAFAAVFTQMKDVQKVAVRTYGSSFGMQSASMHPQKSGNPDGLTLEDIERHIYQLGILSLHVVAAAKDLTHIHNVKGFLKTIADLAKKNEYPVEQYKKITRPSIEVGDFVVAYGDLGQVTKVKKSIYGYRTFRVKYLEQPPMPNIPEDEFPAAYVSLLYKRKPMVDKVKQEIMKETPGEKPSTRILNGFLAEGVVKLWTELGLKEIVMRNPSAVYEKMQQALNKTEKPSK